MHIQQSQHGLTISADTFFGHIEPDLAYSSISSYSSYSSIHLFELFIRLLRARSCLCCKPVWVWVWVVPHTTPCPTLLLFMTKVYSFTVPSFPGIYALPVDNGSWTKTEARALSWNESWKQSTVWKNHQTGTRISHWIRKLFISMI